MGLFGLKRGWPRGAGAKKGSADQDVLVMVYLLIVPVSFPWKASNLMPNSLLLPVLELTGASRSAFLRPPKFGSTPPALRAKSDSHLVTSTSTPFW
jgi:hypothetical protein